MTENANLKPVSQLESEGLGQGGETGRRTGLKTLHRLLSSSLKTERDTREALVWSGVNAIVLKLTTIRYKSFLERFGRKSGKKVQNAEVNRVAISWLPLGKTLASGVPGFRSAA